MKLTAKWVNAGLAVLLVGAGAGAWLAIGSASASENETARTTTVRTGTVTASVSGTGTLDSVATVTADFATGGTLTSVYVKVGDVVKKGEVLAKIDPDDAEQALETAKADLAAAQAAYDEAAQGQTSADATKDELSVESAQLSVDSAETSLDQALEQQKLDAAQQAALVDKAIADREAGKGTTAQVTAARQQRDQTALKNQQSVGQARQQVASAQNQLAQQKATASANAQGPTTADLAQVAATLRTKKIAVQDAQDTVDDTTLRAAAAGTVLSVSSAKGETVSGAGSSSSSGASSSSSAATSDTSSSSASSSSTSSGFITLANLKRLQVTANVAEADIGDIKVDQPAEVTLSASGAVVTGTVTTVALEGTTSSNVVQYPVTVELSEAPDGVRLGASASVSITTGSAEDVLTLPAAAITTVGRTSTVTVMRDGKQTVTPVVTGLVGTTATEITSGVASGDTVVLPTAGASSSNGIPNFGGVGGGLGGPRP